ncbi:hypothetical protein PYW07_012245 [Mythimna separata]|uniref:Uncharacterized protein n=1 Tax=Mythimna separata TaxID=271217 RepID=A0AAD7YKU8_MYTSE|nr:hypothetical protein PYW07_012244 [Mythimna separata]KAJ8720202.1 hypothetical protein PYW07_012245 [Mythimna separata]
MEALRSVSPGADLLPSCDTERKRRKTLYSISQGPLLWNCGYDYVMRGKLPNGVNMICNIDDMLVLVQGSHTMQLSDLATRGVASRRGSGSWDSRWPCVSPKPCVNAPKPVSQ